MAFNDLKNKLLQAGMVDEEQVKKAEADERAAKARRRQQAQKRKGGKGKKGGGGGAPRRPDGPPAPAEERLTPEELAAAEAKKEERERQKALEAERKANRERAAKERAMAEDVRKVGEYLAIEDPGEVSFFFQDRKNRLQRLMISEALQAKLEAGEAAVVEHPLPHAISHVIVPREGAEAVLKINVKAVRFYNRSEEERYGTR